MSCRIRCTWFFSINSNSMFTDTEEKLACTHRASCPTSAGAAGVSIDITEEGRGARFDVQIMHPHSSAACSWSRPFSSSIVERSSSRSLRSCSFSARIASTSTPVGAPMYLFKVGNGPRERRGYGHPTHCTRLSSQVSKNTHRSRQSTRHPPFYVVNSVRRALGFFVQTN